MTYSVGNTFTKETTVSKENVAANYQPGLPEVYATPDMIADMESTCFLGLQVFLPEHQLSVGTHVNVSHDLGVPIGEKITITATIIDIDRRKITFEVEAMSLLGSVGKGTHTRFIMDK